MTFLAFLAGVAVGVVGFFAFIILTYGWWGE